MIVLELERVRECATACDTSCTGTGKIVLFSQLYSRRREANERVALYEGGSCDCSAVTCVSEAPAGDAACWVDVHG